MMENVIFDTKNNYVATGEITVTITLAEYRRLVYDCATSDMRINELKKRMDLIKEEEDGEE